MVQSAPFLLVGVVLSALIATLLSARVLRRVVPANPVLAVPVAGIAGVGLPGCECAAVPIAGGSCGVESRRRWPSPSCWLPLR